MIIAGLLNFQIIHNSNMKTLIASKLFIIIGIICVILNTLIGVVVLH